MRFKEISVTHFPRPQQELQRLKLETAILQSKKLVTVSKSIKNTLKPL